MRLLGIKKKMNHLRIGAYKRFVASIELPIHHHSLSHNCLNFHFNITKGNEKPGSTIKIISGT